MDDSKLFELAVKLTIAEIHTGVIAPALRERDIMLQERIRHHHDELRTLWREQHQTDNVSSLSP